VGALFLLRHGQASLGTADYDQLSPAGAHQAQLAGRRLARAEVALTSIATGALARQQQTLAAVLGELGRPADEAVVDARLDEYDHADVLAVQQPGLSFESTAPGDNRALQSTLDEAVARWMAADSGYREAHGAFVDRVLDASSDALERPGTTLAVTSAGVIGVLVASVLGLDLEQWPALARITVNGSITKIISGRSGRNLLTFNDHAHLEHDRGLITYR
jgi:broad specificity phosphatase PhoE